MPSPKRSEPRHVQQRNDPFKGKDSHEQEQKRLRYDRDFQNTRLRFHSLALRNLPGALATDAGGEQCNYGRAARILYI
jgi:hypothetical protein